MVQGISSNFTDPQVRLQDTTINQPLAFVASSETPTAASGVQTDSFEGKKKGKAGKVVGAIVALAAVVAGLILGAKYSAKIREKLPEVIQKSELANKCLHGLKVAGDKLAEWGTLAIDAVKKILPKAKEAAQDAAGKVAETAT